MVFQRLARLASLDVEEVLATIEPLVARRLRRRGWRTMTPASSQPTDGPTRQLSLKQPWRDGTTALVFDPVEVLGRE